MIGVATMKTLDRILMSLLLLMMIALCVGLILFGVGVFHAYELSEIAYMFEKSWVIRVSVILGAVILIIISVKVLFSRSRFSSQTSSSGGQDAKLLIPLGDNIRMTAEAVNEIISRSAKSNSSVLTASSHITPKDNGYLVRIQVSVVEGVSIPETISEMDARVKQTLLETCSLADITTEILVSK